MSEFENLEKLRDEIIMEKLKGDEPNFVRIRKCCEKLQDEIGFDFELEADNEILWKNIILFFRQYENWHK